MPLGYEMLTIQHTVSGRVQEIYARQAPDFLEHPWFSKFYVIYSPGGYPPDYQPGYVPHPGATTYPGSTMYPGG